MTKSIDAFQDEYGRLTSWPSKRRRAHQLAVLAHLSRLFEGGQLYSEAEVNAVLSDHTTLDDLAMLRRELIDADYLSVGADQQSYWKAGSRPEPRREGGAQDDAKQENN